MNENHDIFTRDPEVFRQCFAGSNDGIVITDTEGRIVEANPAWQDMYGYSLDEARGKTTRIIKSKSTNQEMYAYMWKQIKDPAKGFWKGEIINRRKSGEDVAVLLTITPIRCADEMIGYMGIGIDITERVEAERFKELYDTVVRHDLKAPLGSIITVASTLAGGYLGELTDRQRGMLEKLLKQGQAMQDIIATSLDVEKLKRGRLNLDLEDVDVLDTIRESFEALHGQAEAKQVKFRLIADGRGLVHRLDRTHLRRCADNLIKNAVEASPKGGEVTVHALRTEAGGVRISVHNGGDPIPPDVRPYLFHPYSTYGKRGGTGLGIYGVKLTVEAMGGTIDYETGEQGTTFMIEFPAAG